MSNDNNVSKKKKSPKGRKWCFTAFKKEIDFAKIYKEYKDIIRYLVVQSEICPKSQKFHWQGYIQMFNQCRMRKIKLLFNYMGLHLELARGSAEQNRAYCTKIKSAEGQVFEFGKAVSQGFRSDLESIKKCLDDGGTMEQVANDHFGDYVRYRSNLQSYKNICDKKLRSKRRTVQGILKIGPTGTGKTTGTLDEYGDENVFVMCFNGTEWWDGYEGEKIILIDDYNNDIKINRLLQLMNGVKCRLPIKGGFTWANWDKVILTSNLRINELHSNAKSAHRAALMRRFQRVEDGFKKVSQSVLGNTATKTPNIEYDAI